MSEWVQTLRAEHDEVTAEVRLDFLGHNDLVTLCFNYDATVEKARESEAFVNQILSRLPILEAVVAEAAFKYYLLLIDAFRKIYGEEVQLPVAADATALLAFYQLTTIYLPSESEPGYFGLGFECEFEIEHGMGIRFRNWQIEEIGDESEALSLD